MSGAAEARELEERLREAAALGDVQEVRRLLGAGADINSRNEINGWTCLHWACKRNHAQVVSCLLGAGADKQILTATGELAAELTSKPDIRKILGEEETECQGVKDLNFPVVTNYLANPPFPYVYTEESIPDSLAESQDESASISSASQCETSPCSSAAQAESIHTSTSRNSEEDFPALDAVDPLPILSAAITAPSNSPAAPHGSTTPNNDPVAPNHSSLAPPDRIAPNSDPMAPNSSLTAPHGPMAPNSGPTAPHGPAYQPASPCGTALFSPAASQQAVPLHTNSSPTGPAPAFQPFFLTGTFPYNMQDPCGRDRDVEFFGQKNLMLNLCPKRRNGTAQRRALVFKQRGIYIRQRWGTPGSCQRVPKKLVLKVRVQNLRDDDFIEIELDRQELTYQDLLRVSCCELGINPEHVEKIRKLPNTLVRKDKDVARLQDFQELELVLVKSNSSPFRNAAALTERPSYNSRASRLTY